MKHHAVAGRRDLITGVLLSAIEFPAPMASTMTRIKARISAANANGDLLMDVKKNGVSIFALPADRIKIVAGATTGTVTVSVSLADGDFVTVDVVGAPLGGVSGLFVYCQLETAAGDVVGADLETLSPSPAGVYGDSTHIPQLTVDSKGRVTEADEVTFVALPARGQEVITTGSLANGADETGFTAIGKSGTLIRVETDRACRVRLYSTAAARDDDQDRPEGGARSQGDGLLFEGIFTGAEVVFTQDPVVAYYNGDDPVVDKLYYTIANSSGSTSTVEVTLDYVYHEI